MAAAESRASEEEKDATPRSTRASGLSRRLKAWWSGAETAEGASGEDPPDAEDSAKAAEVEPSESEGTAGATSGASGLVPRLKAWWTGDGPTSPEPTGATEAPVPAAEGPPSPPDGGETPAEPSARWSGTRLEVAQRIWGEGFLAPGGAEFILGLAKPFGLDKSKSLLQIGGGIGGPARAIVESLDTWVTVLELDPALAQIGMDISTAKGLAKRVSVEPFDLNALLAGRKRYDAIIACEALYRIRDKDKLIQHLPKLLKDHGEFVLADFVLASKSATAPALDAWRNAEGTPVHLWTWDEYSKALPKAKLDVRVSEERTDAYAHMAIEAWQRFEAGLKRKGLPDEVARQIFDEGAFWQARLAALESGALRFVRIHAVKK